MNAARTNAKRPWWPSRQERTLLAAAAALLLGLRTTPASAQTIDAATYPFTSGAGVALEDMSSGTTQLLGPDLDIGVSAVAPIGFDVWFAGVRQSSFSVNSEGLMRLGTTAVQTTSTNDMASILNAPQIAPYWDNLWIGTNGKVHYKVVGSPPNRKLVVEWRNVQVPRVGAGFTGAGTFQCWLYETSGRIELVYGAGMATNTAQGGASIGIGSVGGTFASVTSVYPSVAYGTASNANVTAIPSGTQYAFTPPSPAAPTGLAFSQVGSLGMTLGWTDNASNEAGYVIWRSTDGVNYSFVTQTAANATSSVQSGLNPGTTYFWLVAAVSQGALSASLSGSQATTSTGTIVTAGSGSWSSTVPGAPWPGGIVPTSSDQVTIADGHVVTIDATAACYSLTVGQGTSGALRFEDTSARALTVGTNVTIAAGGSLSSGTGGTQTSHALSLGGSLTNQGTLDLSTNANQAAAGLSFTGSSDASLTGNGAVTNVRAITVAKTSGAAVTLDASSFTVQGLTVGAPGFLTLSSGTFKVAGSFTMTTPVFTTAAYTLASGTTFWLANPNLTVLGQAGSATVRGLRVSSGIFNVGAAADQSLLLASGSQLTIEGGELRVAGRLCVSSSGNTVTYVQTGGAVTVNQVGSTSATLADFDLGTGSGSSTAISGGSIVLQNASTAASGPRDYRNSAGTQNLTGGTLQLGNASTAAASTYFLTGTAPSLVVGNLVGGHTARLLAATTVVGSTQIQSGATLDLNGFRFTQSTGGLANEGTLTASAANSEVDFLGSVTPQTYGGSGTASTPISILSVDNPAGVTLDAALAANLVVRRVNLIRGVLGNSQKITLGNADGVTAVTQLGATGVTGAGGSYDVSPIFNAGAAGVSVSYLQEGAPRSTGFEIPSSRVLNGLTVNNPGGLVTVAGGSLAVTKSLTLTAGLLGTTAANVVTLADTASTIPAGSSQSYVDGPLAIAINSSGGASRTFAVGRNGAFRPLVLSSVGTGGISKVFTAELIDGPTGGTPMAPLQSLTSSRYWKLGGSAGLNATARVQVAFATNDNVGTLTNLRVGQSSAASGTYLNLGGTASGTQASGTLISTANLTPGSDYFAIASTGALSSTWDGGAGTTNWGDAANWSPDGVPGSGTDVTLSLATPATLIAAGTLSINNLTLTSNATIQVSSGSLSVGGVLSQSGGAIQLTGGALNVTGATNVSGGTIDLGAQTLTATGAVSVSGGTVSLSTGRFLANAAFAISGGTVALNSGTLELKSSLSRTSGNFFAGTGTTLLSGTTTQDISGGLTYYDLVLRNGGAGLPKRFASIIAETINNDLIVESTAQMALSSSDATPFTVWGNLRYSGISGGSSISSLTINLGGIGRLVSGVGSSGASLLSATQAQPLAADVPTVEHDFLTDPTRSPRLATLRDGKPLLRLDNTYEQRKAQVDQLLRNADPTRRIVINLDDVTLVKNPQDLTTSSAPTASLPMSVTILNNGRYVLDGNFSIGSGRTLTVAGRLDCGDLTLGGAGGVAVTGLGTLGTTTASASGLSGTVVTTGTNSYSDGATIEYNRPGNQTISASGHPAAALIQTAGSGTKTLTASKTITGSSGLLLNHGALFVGSGTTFADGGNRISFTTSAFANVIVQGTYLSTGSGSLSFEAGSFGSNILAPSGTAFGDLLVNFGSSSQTIDLNSNGTSELGFRNLTFGGTAGAGTAGGTLRLSETGTTNVTVSGGVTIAPSATSNSGGGFDGTAGAVGRVTLLGDLTSTSTNPLQPILGGTGSNTLVLAGAGAQSLTLASSATSLGGATLEVGNGGGLSLGGSNLVYAVGAGGVVHLNGRNVAAGTSTLAMSAGSTLDMAGGRVIGRLRKAIASGSPSVTFEIGSASDPTPVTLAFGNVTTPGDLTARSEAGDHPQVATSGIDGTKSLNRYFVLGNSGVTFDACDVSFTFPAAEVDAGANTGAFVVRKFDGTAWQAPVAANQTPIGIRANGVTSFSDFAIGEQSFVSVTSTAGPNGAIAPAGSTQVGYGFDQIFTLTPAAGYHVADILVDGVSVGAAATYTLTNVTASHNVQASFALNTYTITASAGLGGTITPAGAVSVSHGTSQSFTITPANGYEVADVLVDGASVGAVGTYDFTSVVGNRTISASFSPVDAVITSPPPQTAISTAHPCVTVPVVLNRISQVGLRGFSARFTLSPEMTLCSGTASVTEGPFLNVIGATYFTVVDRGGGTYQVDCAILGAVCGQTATQGTLFTIGLASSAALGTGTIALDSLKLRDCDNTPISAVAGNTASVQIDNTPPVVTVSVPNGGETWPIGSPQTVTWSATDENGIGSVDLDYSTDGGQTYPYALATATANSGSFPWTVAATPSTQARVRVTARDQAGNVQTDASDAGFTIRPFAIQASSGAGGTIDPTGTVTANFGEAKTFTLAPDVGHHVADVLVDGVSIGAVASHAFENIQADHTIAATFAINTHTLSASAGAGGTISPSGDQVVNEGQNLSFTITPATGYHVAAVLVDGVSVGAVTSYAFDNVTADHTIAASFTINTYAIIASAGANGAISPDGSVTVHHGSDQIFDITPSPCYRVSDVLVDGVSIGPVTTYTFTAVTAGHSIAASFALATETVTASAGANGTISPPGASTVDCGTSLAYAITPATGYHVVDVLVDGVSVGAVSSYTFSSVSANHTIAVSFAINLYAITASAGANGTIAPSGATSVSHGASQAYTITPASCAHVADVLVDGVSVGAVTGYTFSNVTADHTIAASFAINTYTLTASAGANGTISPLGASTIDCGTSLAYAITPATGYHVADVLVDAVSVGAVSSYTFNNVTADHTIATSFVVNPAVAAISDLAATQVKSGNDGDGTTKILLSWTAVPAGSTVEIYRAGFGAYPEYDDGGGVIPSAPSYPPGAPWSATAVTSPGGVDELSGRDFYYYVAFVTDTYGTHSPASNLTAGTLNYHLGDVSNGTTPGQGDNVVDLADISLLGAHYGLTGAAAASYGYLDVGPTTDRTVDGRPMTDDSIEFEDLMMFAINFEVVSQPISPTVTDRRQGSPQRSRPASQQATDALGLTVAAQVTTGDVFNAHLSLAGTGGVQAISVLLAWDPAVVEPISASGTSTLGDQGGVAFPPQLGALDAALLGVRGVGLAGEFGTITFRAIASGDAGVHVATVRARSSDNQDVAISLSGPGPVGVPDLPRGTSFRGAYPNPFLYATTLEFGLARAGAVQLSIYGVDGRRVRTLIAGRMEPGFARPTWDGRDDQGQRVPAGVYFARLVTPDGSFSRRIVSMR